MIIHNDCMHADCGLPVTPWFGNRVLRGKLLVQEKRYGQRESGEGKEWESDTAASRKRLREVLGGGCLV